MIRWVPFRFFLTSLFAVPLFLGVLVVLGLGGCATGPSGRDQADGTVSRGISQEVEDRLQAMTLRERIGQRFLVHVPRGFARDGGVSEDYVTLLKEGAPAGMIVYPWNYRNRQELETLTGKLQRLARYHSAGGSFLIAADQEGGRVAAYRFADLPRFPSAAVMARQARAGTSNAAGTPDRTYIYSQAYITGRDLLSMGINLNFAPVADLSDRPDRAAIGDRSWGNDPGVVSDLTRAYLGGLGAAGVIGTVKHFPGHGVTRVDSHGRLPVADMTLDELIDRDMHPFIGAVSEGVPAIMTAHILFPRIDGEYPVTISEVFLHDLLRLRLGYEGVVITDGLSMGALANNYDIDLVLERALRYDVDLILLHDRYDIRDIMSRVMGLLESGRISEADIDRGVRRVLTLKEQYGLLD